MNSLTYRPAGRVSELEGLGDARVVVIGAGQAGLPREFRTVGIAFSYAASC